MPVSTLILMASREPDRAQPDAVREVLAESEARPSKPNWLPKLSRIESDNSRLPCVRNAGEKSGRRGRIWAANKTNRTFCRYVFRKRAPLQYPNLVAKPAILGIWKAAAGALLRAVDSSRRQAAAKTPRERQYK